MAPKKSTKAAPAPKKTIRKAAAEEKAAAKSEKSSKLKAKAVEEAPAISEDSDEDADEAMMVSVSSTSASMSMSAGAAGPTGPTAESSAGVRSFRHHPEIENFYRFIYENDLRYEALAIIEEILHEKKARKSLQMKKSKAH